MVYKYTVVVVVLLAVRLILLSEANGKDGDCSLRHEVDDLIMCKEGVSCKAPLHGSAMLSCPGQSGRWVHNSTTVVGVNNNLTLTLLQFNDSGSYHYDAKQSCDFLAAVGALPVVTAPDLNCDEPRCCYLPEYTVLSSNQGMDILCNTSGQASITWYMDNNVPAIGNNNGQVYRTPYFVGKENTTERYTCVVTNGYGNTTLTYEINVIQAPVDKYTKYKEAIAQNGSFVCTEGTDVAFSYRMNYISMFSLAKFCFFPNGTYNLLYNFLEFNDSTCCVCLSTDCEGCNKMNWTISSSENSVTQSYNFTIHIKDISTYDYGLYTLTACVFQIDDSSCGKPAWTELKVYPPSNSKHRDTNLLLWVLLSAIVVIGGAVIVLLIPISYCCWKHKSKKKKIVYAKLKSPVGGGDDEGLHIGNTNIVRPKDTSEPPHTPLPVSATGTLPSFNDEVRQRQHLLATSRHVGMGATEESSKVPGRLDNFDVSPQNNNSTGKVLIVYCKEDNVRQPPVQEFSDFLRKCGVDSEVDFYHSTDDITNWSQWTELRAIECCKENGYILLLCGKSLHQHLQNCTANEKVNMHYGFIGRLKLCGLIEHAQMNTRFLPIFFDKMDEQFVPTELQSRNCYTIRTAAIVEYIEGSMDVDTILQSVENCSLKSLISKLTKQPEYDKPAVNTHRIQSDVSEKLSTRKHYAGDEQFEMEQD